MSWYDDGGESRLAAAEEAYAERLAAEDEERRAQEAYERALLRMEIEREEHLLDFEHQDLSDGDKLRLVAEWFERVYPRWKRVVRDQQEAAGWEHASGEAADDHSVERELRRIASRTDALDEVENPKPFRPGQGFEVRDTSRRRYG